MKNNHNPNEEFETQVVKMALFFIALFALITILSVTFTKCYGQTKDSVYMELIKQDVKHPKVVLAQVIKETGWMECEKCSLDHNNLFGLRYKGEYLKFNHWKESIARYKKFQDKRYDGEKDYLEFLDCIWLHSNGDCARYATDENYTDELAEIIKQL